MIMQLCIWHDSIASAKKPTGEGMMFPLTADYWAPHKTNPSGLMGTMCRRCKNRRLKAKRHANIKEARAIQVTQEPVITVDDKPMFARQRFNANFSGIESIYKAV